MVYTLTKNKSFKWSVRWAGVLSVLLFLLLGASAVGAEPLDSDGDGLSDQDERTRYYTNYQEADTDGDGYPDGLEIANGYSPHAGGGALFVQQDYDRDGLNDALELVFDTDLGNPDTDGDGHNDFTELMWGYHPADPLSVRQFERRIVVDKDTQHLSYMVNDVEVLRYPVSTGNPLTETPSGHYHVKRRVSVMRYRGPGYDLPGVKWNVEFLPSYFIHTAYWHDNFGQRTMSHGCVNMRESDAAVIYRYVEPGVPVEVVGQTPKGPVVGVS